MTVYYENKKFNLIEEATLNYDSRYGDIAIAQAIGENGEKYLVYWLPIHDLNSDYELADCFNWNEPYTVEEID